MLIQSSLLHSAWGKSMAGARGKGSVLLFWHTFFLIKLWLVISKFNFSRNFRIFLGGCGLWPPPFKISGSSPKAISLQYCNFTKKKERKDVARAFKTQLDFFGLYTLLIIPDAWRQLVKGSLFLFQTKQKASLYFTNWRHISGIINKVYRHSIKIGFI